MPYFSLVFWVVLIIVFIVAEALTVQLTAIWFAAGALAAFVVALINPDAYLIQILVFVAVSAITLAITRPLAKKLTSKTIQPTNADRYIGKEVLVTEEINNRRSTGAVQASGVIWTARSIDDIIIPPEAVVVVERIDGVKLMVRTK
ncbi:MAG: NfeD family protein [Oscillospiraceae bacterium]|jgi:membrane protein implicated in regulation of membrane protease activity|nr:NfeD family protein [Oscillospiraceae bacterium]